MKVQLKVVVTIGENKSLVLMFDKTLRGNRALQKYLYDLQVKRIDDPFYYLRAKIEKLEKLIEKSWSRKRLKLQIELKALQLQRSRFLAEMEELMGEKVTTPPPLKIEIIHSYA